MENPRSNRLPVQNHQHPVHQVGLENIQLQAVHSSPYHVHPYPAPVAIQQAFQSPETNMFLPKGLRQYQGSRDGPILGRALCLTPKHTPASGRVSHLNEKFQDSVTMYADTNELVARISSMFPTVGHTHIRILLKKYYNREAVVISALQVEKHPIATPGPLTMSPSAARLDKDEAEEFTLKLHPLSYPGALQFGGYSSRPEAIQGTSAYYRGARPCHPNNQPVRPSSPKLKLKYLKGVYPKADEICILELLAKNDNAVNVTGRQLEALGYTKKDKTQQKKEPTPQPAKKVVLMQTAEDRQKLFEKLQNKYWSIPERLITIALDTVEYDEDKAHHILSILLQEESSPRQNTAEGQEARPREEKFPNVAWYPNEWDEHIQSASSPLAFADAPVPAYAIIPAYMLASVPVPGYGHVPALVPVHVHVLVHAPPHVTAHASAHMAAHGHRHAHPQVLAYAPAFMAPYGAMHAHAHAHAHVHAHSHVHSHAHAHVQGHAHSHAHAHAHARCHVHAHAAAPRPAPAARLRKTRNAPKIESKPQLEAATGLNELPQEAVSEEPVVKTPVQRETNYQSQYSNGAAGPNPAMRHGPRENLLLEDYMPWNGPNPELRMSQGARPGRKPEQQSSPNSLARGPSGLAQGPSGLAQGPSGLARGPSGLAKGSMYRNRK